MFQITYGEIVDRVRALTKEQREQFIQDITTPSGLVETRRNNPSPKNRPSPQDWATARAEAETLSYEVAEEIRKRYIDGMNQSRLATEYGIRQTAVSLIVRNFVHPSQTANKRAAQ